MIFKLKPITPILSNIFIEAVTVTSRKWYDFQF